MSRIEYVVLNVAYQRHDDRELWDVEPIFRAGPRYSRFMPIAKGTRVKATPPSQYWWSRSQILGDAVLGDCPGGPPVLFDDRIDPTGAMGFPYRIRGIAQDDTATGVGGAVMQLFKTSTDEFLRDAVSVGPSGQYDLGTDDNVTQHYIVGYRTGPDIMGTTVNTLTGS
jgi:hypothetical protein